MADQDDKTLTGKTTISGGAVRPKKGNGADNDPLLFDVKDTSDKGGFDLDDVLKQADKIVIADSKPQPQPKKKPLGIQPVKAGKRVVATRPAGARPKIIAKPKTETGVHTETGKVSLPIKPAGGKKIAAKPRPSTPLAPKTIPIPLELSEGLQGLDEGENVSVLIEGLLPGASLSSGTKKSPSVWQLSFGQLEGLNVYPPQGRELPFDLTVTVKDGESVLLTGEIEVTPIDDNNPQKTGGTSPLAAPWGWDDGRRPEGPAYKPDHPETVSLSPGGRIVFDPSLKPVKWK